MKTLQRIKDIQRSRKATTLIAVGGDLTKELQKHLNTLNQRIATIELGQAVAAINQKEWDTIIRQIRSKKHYAKDDEKRLQSLNRLEDIAGKNAAEAIRQVESFVGKTEELVEIRKRIVQALSMIEVENNVRSITAMYEGQSGFELQTASLKTETREIRRLLYATDGLMEITS